MTQNTRNSLIRGIIILILALIMLYNVFNR